MARILVTDDAIFMRTMLKGILEPAGYEIDEATNGKDAVDKCKGLKYDLVMLDITMPEMDGLEAIKRIRSVNPNQKCIMCSAMGQQAMVLEAIKNGAMDFIVKPFKPEDVLEKVGKIIV